MKPITILLLVITLLLAGIAADWFIQRSKFHGYTSQLDEWTQTAESAYDDLRPLLTNPEALNESWRPRLEQAERRFEQVGEDLTAKRHLAPRRLAYAHRLLEEALPLCQKSARLWLTYLDVPATANAQAAAKALRDCDAGFVRAALAIK